MREILFRGKRIDNGEWVEGNFIKDEKPDMREYYIQTIPTFEETFGVLYELNADSIGQFTGLVDKNGMKIFEGDIVKLSVLGKRNHKRYEVFYDVETGQRLMKNGDGINDCENLTGVFARADCEVIGNIYDNPELLGGEDV